MKRSTADMLYQVKLSNKPAYLYMLCEHTSEPDPCLAFRIVKYIFRIIQQHIDQYPNDPLPVVYPIILYTENKPYTETLDWYALFGEQRQLMHQIFTTPFQLIEVCKIPDPTLQQHVCFDEKEGKKFINESMPYLTPQLLHFQKVLINKRGWHAIGFLLWRKITKKPIAVTEPKTSYQYFLKM